MREPRRLALVMAVAAAAAGGAALMGGQQATAAQPRKAIDPEAQRLLKQMTDYVSGLQTFTLEVSAVDEKALASGEKIQRTSDSEVAVVRPDRLRNTQRGSGNGLGLWYDGKTMTLACKGTSSYATIPAPPTLDAAIDTMRKQFQIDAPGADLLYSHPYDILMEQVTGGRVIGHETVNGAAATHLAFEGEEVDWQIWIQDGPQPVPLRFVITTKTVKGRPQFAVQFSRWDTETRPPDSTFHFQPPAGATRVQSVASSCGPSR
jgi:hypothetical protein